QKCRVLQDVVEHLDYALYGIVTYLREKVNIAPSITYAVESSPDEIKMIYSEEYEEEVPRGCHGNWYQYVLGIDQNGIVSSKCVSNNATLFPDYSEGTSTTMPVKPTRCDDKINDVQQYSKGLKYGMIREVSIDELKQFITRVGPVNGVIKYYKDIEDILYEEGIFYGWEGNEWIVAKKYTQKSDLYGEVSYYLEDRLPFVHTQYGTSSKKISGSVFYYDCSKLTLETIAEACPGPTDKKSQQYKDDPRTAARGLCQSEICTAKGTPSAECVCPDVKEGGYTKEKCEADKESEKDSAGLVQMTLGVFVAVVVLPVLALFF
ncbi:MAG: hypothetical protein EZS28_047794, partial [Streblomastix strix]